MVLGVAVAIPLLSRLALNDKPRFGAWFILNNKTSLNRVRREGEI